MSSALFPFITLPDQETSAEGSLDPLGLSSISDRLANTILPGLRARMSRPRFLTAMAVSASVCEGLEEKIAADGTTFPEIVFEWLLAEGFARSGSQENVRRTPGIDKARACVQSGEPMRAKAYLKNPGVFGFHGVYKPLAVDLGIVDDDFMLSEQGYALLNVWEQEQQVSGFIDRAISGNGSSEYRATIRAALEDSLNAGQSKRSSAWQGWRFFTGHLLPTQIGKNESDLIWKLLVNSPDCLRGELFNLLAGTNGAEKQTEREIIQNTLLNQASPQLKARLLQIEAYESFVSLIEDAFGWMRYCSSQAGARTIGHEELTSKDEFVEIANNLATHLNRAEHKLADAPLSIQQEYGRLANFFSGCNTPQNLYEAVLARHTEVQRNKPPEGKREWFERDSSHRIFVRIPYRLDEKPAPRNYWARPYRITAALSFIRDLRGNENGPQK